jgi:hypothetical protein
MDEQMRVGLLTGLLTILGTIAGGIVGWALNSWSTQRDERKRAAEAQEREADIHHRVRLLLRLECKQNVAALVEFWASVSSAGVHVPEQGMLVGIGTSPSEGEFDQRQRLAVLPLPVWRRHMWKSQAGSVAQTLKPDEIDRVYTRYSDLETFAARREELRAHLATPAGQKLAQRYSQWMQEKHRGHPHPGGQDEVDIEVALMEFNNKTRALWNECLAIYNRALPYMDRDILAP